MKNINEIDISLIIVNWNTKDLLIQCIESIYKKTKKITYEIIVVDNASNDGSVFAVKKKYPEVLVIENQKNLGFAAANNIGIKKAQGNYIGLINSDIVFIENSLYDLMKIMDSEKSIGAGGPLTLGEDLKKQYHCRRFPNLINGFNETFYLDKLFPKKRLFQGRLVRDISTSETSFVDVLPMCFLLIKRETLKEIGLLDEMFFIYGEDKDWCKRLSIGKWRLMFYPGTSAIHLGSGSSSAEPLRFNLEMIKSDFQYWQKHHNKFQYLLYVLLKIVHQLIRMIALVCIHIFKINRRNNYMDLKDRKKCLLWIIKNALTIKNKSII